MNSLTSFEFTLAGVVLLTVIRLLMTVVHLLITWRINVHISDLKYLQHKSLAYGQGINKQIALVFIQIILCILSLSWLILVIPILIIEFIVMIRFVPYLNEESKHGRTINTIDDVVADYSWNLPKLQFVESIIIIFVAIIFLMTK